MTAYKKKEVKLSFGDVVTYQVPGEPGFDYVMIRTPKQMLIIGPPDSDVEPGNRYDLGIYVADHAYLYIRGSKKQNPELCLASDEYPTTLQINEEERVFDKPIPFVVRDRKVLS